MDNGTINEDRPLKGCAAEGRNVTAITCKCPSCGAEIEMFSDETKVKCSNCGKEITIEECRKNQV